MKLQCFLQLLWLTWRHGVPVSGCVYEDQERNVLALVDTLRCACGKWAIDWRRVDDSEIVTRVYHDSVVEALEAEIAELRKVRV